MKRTSTITTFLTVAGLVVVGVTAASAANDQGELNKSAAAFAANVDRWDAADNWKGNSTRAAADRVAGLQLVAGGFDDRVSSAAASSSYRSGKGVELVAVPTEKGGLCFGSARGDKALSAACAPSFDETGTMLVYRNETGAPDEVSGLVAQDVTSIVATLDDGSSHDLDIKGGAVVWTAPQGRLIDAIVSTRAGKQHTQSFTDRP